MQMDAHWWFELGALPRERRHGRKRRENPDEIVDIPVRLLDRKGFRREPPDIIEIGEGAAQAGTVPIQPMTCRWRIRSLNADASKGSGSPLSGLR